MLTIDYDRSAGVINVTGGGLWSLDEIDVHLAALAATVLGVRASGGVVRVLADTSAAVLQSAEVAVRIHEGARAIYRAGDRVALIVSSPLHKMQMRRVVDPAIITVFRSHIGAKAWLRAGDAAAAA